MKRPGPWLRAGLALLAGALCVVCAGDARGEKIRFAVIGDFGSSSEGKKGGDVEDHHGAMLIEATPQQLTFHFYSVSDKGAPRLHDTCRLTKTKSGQSLKCEKQ